MSVPGATYWSSSILDNCYYSRPLKFIGTYYSVANVIFISFLVSSIYLTTTIICLSSVNSSNCYCYTEALGKNNL